ncbi:uncharacterized protein HD556DRAFT_1307595 [Suillus plorans]|uniref:Uncharacterized protein n=1 Tax=Suillus plorans TaxID=116603 RepID=A0A9P7AS75_9AGAM|nr:uncharacterized protein HD556DRAFT_1307595 [Suillus plorans]KAG1795444.1 hypothetical protein HD556DRAFT_1307595 [Suillus plorans]
MWKKNTGVAIPKIEWTADVIWQLLAQIELPENRVILLGKRKKGERTSGDSKVTVYQRMGSTIFLQLHSLNAVAIGECIKWKYEHHDHAQNKFVGKRPPKASSLSQGSIEKARLHISKIPKKWILDETLIDMQRASLEAISARAAADMCLQERQMLLKEFTAGIWDVDEYCAKLHSLTRNSNWGDFE